MQMLQFRVTRNWVDRMRSRPERTSQTNNEPEIVVRACAIACRNLCVIAYWLSLWTVKKLRFWLHFVSSETTLLYSSTSRIITNPIWIPRSQNRRTTDRRPGCSAPPMYDPNFGQEWQINIWRTWCNLAWLQKAKKSRVFWLSWLLH